MKKAEISHLATLARIRLTEQELERLEIELSSIMSYVSAVSDIAGDGMDDAPLVGARYNIFRKDEVTNSANEYTDTLLAEMPHTEGRMMMVKKILKQDD